MDTQIYLEHLVKILERKGISREAEEVLAQTIINTIRYGGDLDKLVVARRLYNKGDVQGCLVVVKSAV